jgi:hypothetical protein
MVALLAQPTKNVLDFDKAEIIEALSGKQARLAVAFSTACAQRLVNSFGPLEEYEEAKSVARTTLQALGNYLAEGVLPPEDLYDQVIELIPDADDDPSFAAGTLDDALAALAFSVQASTTASIESACNAATRAVDTAFRYATQSFNERLLSPSSFFSATESPIVQRELERQKRDLAEIEDGTERPQTTISRVIDRSLSEAVLERI